MRTVSGYGCATGRPHLDPVDEAHLLRVRELERRARDLEDVHAGAVLLGVRLALGQADDVAVEGECGIQVVGLEHEAQL